MLSNYYQLTKPGVTYGNVITVAAGFLLAAGYFNRFDPSLFVATTLGMTLVIASACVLNNFLDQDIDRIMQRTKTRGVASGEVPGRNAVIFSGVLGFCGLATLLLATNWLVVGIGVTGFIIYVWLYGALSKRLSIHGTLVGSISGAMPILAGYCAVSGTIDAGAILVFLVLFFWQFPEFYSIAIYRRSEYKKAGIPVMPVVVGIKNTVAQIFIYTTLFVTSTLLLTYFSYTGYTYFVVMALFGAYWIWLAAKGFKTKKSYAWARQMFRFSLIILIVFCVMISADSLLP